MSLVRKGGYSGGNSYLLIDNTASGRQKERIQCCTMPVTAGSNELLNPQRRRPRGHCDRCARYLCDRCDAVKHIAGCTFIDEMIEVALSNEHMYGIRDLAFLNHDGNPSEVVKMLRDKKRIAGIGATYTPKSSDKITESGIIITAK